MSCHYKGVMETKYHKTTLKNLMPKSGEYPVALRESKSILVEEQSNLIPIYKSGGYVNFLEAKVKDAMQKGNGILAGYEKMMARKEIDDFRGKVENFVYGMKAYGLSGIPDMMVLTDDLNSPNPAVTKPNNPDFSFEIKPKDFRLGLTGRLLEDENGQKYDEDLYIGFDIYDAFNFATSISPKRVFALTEEDKEILVYERDKYNIGKIEELDIQREKRHFVMSEDRRKGWMCKTEVLPTGGLKVISSDFYDRIKNYEQRTFIFGHNYNNIIEFLNAATTLDDHLIWKICKSDRGPNTPLIDAEPYYGLYQGRPRHENIDRLHFMPSKASLWFDGTMISFDKSVGINSLMNLGNIVRDIWFEPVVRKWDEGWDIVFDRSRDIQPEKPVEVYEDTDYQKYPVIKDETSKQIFCNNTLKSIH